jgi:hypothetical protein
MWKWLLLTLAVAAISIATVAMAEPEANQPPVRRPNVDAARREQPAMPAGEAYRRPDPARLIQMLVSSPEAAERAGLKPEQVAQLKDMQLKAEKELIGLRARVDETRLDLRRQMSAEELDERAVEKAVDRSLEAEMALRRFELMQTVKTRQIVGPEVVQRMQRMVAERMERARAEGGERPMREPGAMRPNAAGEGVRRGDGGATRPWLQNQMPPPDERRKD